MLDWKIAKEENFGEKQVDKIGRIFAHWVIVYFGYIF
jgi:hypothetical protein